MNTIRPLITEISSVWSVSVSGLLRFLLILSVSLTFNLGNAENLLPPYGTTSQQEVWDAYLQNRKKIDTKLSEAPDSQTAFLALQIAIAAIYREDDNYQEHLQRAIDLDTEAKNRDPRHNSTLSFVIGPLLETGLIDTAIKLAEKSKKLSESGNSNVKDPKLKAMLRSVQGGLTDGMIAEAVGHYAAEENALLQRMTAMQSLLKETAVSSTNMLVGSQLSKLATCQAMQGKYTEAEKSLEQALALRGKNSSSRIRSRTPDTQQKINRQFDLVKFWELVSTANACLLVGKSHEAQELIAAGLEMKNLQHVERHQDFWKIHSLAGRVCFQRGEAGIAVDHWKDALAAARRPNPLSGHTLPPDHSDMVAIKQGLA